MSKKSPDIKTLKKAILETLAYSAVFKYPLSFHQLGTYVGAEVNEYKKFVKALRQLEKQKKISQKYGKYHLFGKHTVKWDKKLKLTKKKVKEDVEILEVLQKIPWIQMIALTGPLAAANPDKKGDVDVFIVSKKRRLWLTRFFVFLYLKALGKYRTDKNPAGKVCPNLLVTEDNLAWDSKRQNLYVASEIVRMQPILDKRDTYLRFLEANSWIKGFFPNFRWQTPEKKKNFNFGVLDVLEYFAFIGQKFYMSKKITSEQISLKFIHFNRDDKTEAILEKFKNISTKIA
ncbi:hypothetical protein GF360_01380 [candidate division WWE3 bacterium]|nr:hypothetical protein [candidate division WWE3 bacterium]